MNKGTVFVGLSGGVDSSVSAYLLQKEGYAVVGVFIKVWQPDFLRCHWEDERLDAMRVAAHLGIPFLTCNAEEAYKKNVADHFIAEYKAGRTPNPDVMCNSHIKFGAFYAFARENGADFIATGHYARVEAEKEGVVLRRGIDHDKDQSYFLWNAPEEALTRTLFPVGGLKKSEVRRLAAKAGLPTAEKRDSQGICFLGHVDIYEFLSHYMDFKEGTVMTEDGRAVGTHRGAELYTLGQRHGFEITEKSEVSTPYFVTARDIEHNVLVVSLQPKVNTGTEDTIPLHSVRIFGKTTLDGRTLSIQTRYRGTTVKAILSHLGSDTYSALPVEPYETPAEGQSCVLYDGEVVVGGGIIGRAL